MKPPPYLLGGQMCRAKGLAASRLCHIAGASRQAFCGTGIAPANLIGGFDVKDIQQKHARYTSGDLA
jgi:Ser-tRNA(Ala) deacylase AlaX